MLLGSTYKSAVIQQRQEVDENIKCVFQMGKSRVRKLCQAAKQAAQCLSFMLCRLGWQTLGLNFQDSLGKPFHLPSLGNRDNKTCLQGCSDTGIK